MYIIKQIPEDFRVKEISNLKIYDKGAYSYFLLKKKDYTTFKAIEQISKNLNLPIKSFGFAGNKDKKAITEQFISIKTTRNIKDFKIKDISLKSVGKGQNPISLGDLAGNEFIITVRNLEKEPLIKINKIPNHFDEQRFSKNNAAIGKAIVKKDFKKATELILENKGDYEKKLQEYLSKNKNDYIGALRTINKKILKLYIHAYQSLIFNETIKHYLKLKNYNIKIPIIGFGTEIKDTLLKEIIDNILNKEKINFRDFIISQIPELSSEGTERNLFIEIKDFKILEKGRDELNPDKYKIVLKFTLEKGSYATIVVKHLFTP